VILPFFMLLAFHCIVKLLPAGDTYHSSYKTHVISRLSVPT